MRWASDVSWSLSEMIRFWTQSVDFHHFGTTSTSWDWPNWGFPCILWRSHGRNGLKFGMLMYRDHLQKSLYHLHNMIVRFGGGGGGSRDAQFSFRPADYLPLHFGLNFRNPSYIYIRACCIIYICSLYNSVHKFTRVSTVWKSLNPFANRGKPNRIRLPDLGSWQEFDSAWHHRMTRNEDSGNCVKRIYITI